MLAERLPVVFGADEQLPFVLSIDSNGLYSTNTTLHEGHDYRLRPTVGLIRGLFEERRDQVHAVETRSEQNIGCFNKAEPCNIP